MQREQYISWINHPLYRKWNCDWFANVNSSRKKQQQKKTTTKNQKRFANCKSNHSSSFPNKVSYFFPPSSRVKIGLKKTNQYNNDSMARSQPTLPYWKTARPQSMNLEIPTSFSATGIRVEDWT
mmetsp:Transcript_14849/g.30620  ORF Transcript_14849/g.30620 Transcript_14849/m.30620 type:complete len:124 (-) Transcript_14849:45-416(-)